MPLPAQLIGSLGVGSQTGTTKPVDRKTMRMPCITSTLHATHADQTSQRFDSKMHVCGRVTQVKGTYLLGAHFDSRIMWSKGRYMSWTEVMAIL